MDLNNISLTGRLTKDAEMTQTNTGKTIAKFSIAVGGYKKDETHFFNCAKWNAEKIIQYLVKGKKVGISGELQQQKWNDQATGQAKSRIIINVNSLVLLDSMQQNNQGLQPKQSTGQQNANNIQSQFNGEQVNDPFKQGQDDLSDIPF